MISPRRNTPRSRLYSTAERMSLKLESPWAEESRQQSKSALIHSALCMLSQSRHSSSKLPSFLPFIRLDAAWGAHPAVARRETRSQKRPCICCRSLAPSCPSTSRHTAGRTLHHRRRIVLGTLRDISTSSRTYSPREGAILSRCATCSRRPSCRG